MAVKNLTKGLATQLLQLLATDDDFRARYKKHPRATLLALGVPASDLPATIPPIATLADKLVFAHALSQVQAGHATVSGCMHPPTISLKIS